MANEVGEKLVWVVSQKDKVGENQYGMLRYDINELEWLEDKGTDWDGEKGKSFSLNSSCLLVITLLELMLGHKCLIWLRVYPKKLQIMDLDWSLFLLKVLNKENISFQIPLIRNNRVHGEKV